MSDRSETVVTTVNPGNETTGGSRFEVSCLREPLATSAYNVVVVVVVVVVGMTMIVVVE